MRRSPQVPAVALPGLTVARAGPRAGVDKPLPGRAAAAHSTRRTALASARASA
jgi:hypothetical protein